jgi:hypothetical protein
MTATFEFLEPTTTGLSCCLVRTLAGACFGPDRLERFALWRRWSDAPSLGFLLMNPSIADEDRLDQTLKRCASWATDLGYGGMEIVNVFPLVSTDPRGLGAHDHDETAARNAAHIRDLQTDPGLRRPLDGRVASAPRNAEAARDCWRARRY